MNLPYRVALTTLPHSDFYLANPLPPLYLSLSLWPGSTTRTGSGSLKKDRLGLRAHRHHRQVKWQCSTVVVVVVVVVRRSSGKVVGPAPSTHPPSTPTLHSLLLPSSPSVKLHLYLTLPLPPPPPLSPPLLHISLLTTNPHPLPLPLHLTYINNLISHQPRHHSTKSTSARDTPPNPSPRFCPPERERDSQTESEPPNPAPSQPTFDTEFKATKSQQKPSQLNPAELPARDTPACHN